MPDVVVHLEDVRKSFGRRAALEGVTLDIPEGSLYGVIGPNGSGKTTLIRTLVGLIRADRGEVQVLGARMPSTTVLSRIGYMTQLPSLYPDLTIHENLEFLGKIFGVDHLKLRIHEVLELVALGPRAHDLVAELSGGMRQRAALAAALLHSPAVVFLDEPTVGVDPELRVQFWRYFRELTSRGTTIIVTSHILDEAGRCDRLAFLRDGVVLREGTPAEIRRLGGSDDLEQSFLRLAGISP